MDRDYVGVEVEALKNAIKDRQIKSLNLKEELVQINNHVVDAEAELEFTQRNLQFLIKSDIVNIREYQLLKEHYRLQKQNLSKVKEARLIKDRTIVAVNEEIRLMEGRIILLNDLTKKLDDNIISIGTHNESRKNSKQDLS